MIATPSNWVDDNGVVVRLRVRNWRNYDYNIDTGVEDYSSRVDAPEHCVVPSMTLSMQQILERHKRGVQLPSNSAFYDSEIPDFGKMDKFDVIDAARANAAMIKDHQDGVSAKKAKMKADKLAADAAELERLRALSLGNQAPADVRS